MEFRSSEAIYLQIVDYVSDKILLQRWLPETKMPSVRDLAVTLEVNPNTVMRSYEHLQNADIIYNKRGVGVFVAENAIKKIKALRKKQFLEKDLPLVFKNMYVLGIELKEIQDIYEKFQPESYLKDENKDHEKE
ncbi:MAG: GntR family transcriptional regulator [Bacteroidota bacterium]